jgi:hypothetical protein
VFCTLALAMSGVLGTAGPAGALITNNCGVGEFPQIAAGQSALKVACTFGAQTTVASGSTGVDVGSAAWLAGAQTLNVTSTAAFTTSGTIFVVTASASSPASITYTGTTATSFTGAKSAAGTPTGSTITTGNLVSAGVSSSTVIHDYSNALWHWGAGHNVTASWAVDSFTLTLSAGSIGTTCPATSAAACDINHSIEGTGLPPGDFITGFSAGTITIGPNPTKAASAGSTLLVANTPARGVADGVTNCGGIATRVCSASAHFLTGTDTPGKTIGGGSIPDGATIVSVVSSTEVSISAGTSVSASNQNLGIASGNPVTSARESIDAVFTAANKMCSPSARFAATDLELPVTSALVPAQAITAVASPGACPAGQTEATVSPGGLTISTAKHTIVIGLPTKTAPTNGAVAGSLGSELSLNPTLTPTSPPCSLNKITGFSIPSLWYNPGGYNVTAPPGISGAGAPLNFAATGKPPTSVAQFTYRTVTVNFSGFLVQEPASKKTTVAAASNGVDVGSAAWHTGGQTLNVASTTGFPTSGIIYLQTSGAASATITYTGVTGTTFTGAQSAAATPAGSKIATGNAVSTLPDLSPQTLAHWAVNFGFLPIAIGVCPGSSTASTFGFNATAPNNLTGAQAQTPPNTTVAASSNGTDTATWTGSGTLDVASTVGWPSGGGSFKVVTTPASPGSATVTYTGKTATSFIGLTRTAGSGVVNTGAAVTPVTARTSSVGPDGTNQIRALTATAATATYTAFVNIAWNQKQPTVVSSCTIVEPRAIPSLNAAGQFPCGNG